MQTRYAAEPQGHGFAPPVIQLTLLCARAMSCASNSSQLSEQHTPLVLGAGQDGYETVNESVETQFHYWKRSSKNSCSWQILSMCIKTHSKKQNKTKTPYRPVFIDYHIQSILALKILFLLSVGTKPHLVFILMMHPLPSLWQPQGWTSEALLQGLWSWDDGWSMLSWRLTSNRTGVGATCGQFVFSPVGQISSGGPCVDTEKNQAGMLNESKMERAEITYDAPILP